MRKSKIKFIITIIVLIVMLGTATGVIGYYSNWFTNWDKFNPKNWFGDKTDNTEQLQDNSGSFLNLITNNGFSFVSEKISSSEFLSNGIAETVDSAYQLNATIQPSVAENKNVCWSARWNNISSEWAHDKDIADYLTFNKATTQSGESVIVTCLQDFGEQILITASAEADSTKKAICSVDYRKRIKRLDYIFKYDNNNMENVVADTDGVYRFDFTKENKSYMIEPIPIYSTYTIDVNYSRVVTGTFTDTFGFGSTTSLNNLSLDTYIAPPAPEPELGDYANHFLAHIDTILNGRVNVSIVDFVEFYYKKLSDIEKTHSRIVRSYYVFSKLKKMYPLGPENDVQQKNYVEKFTELYNSYEIPILYSTFMGVELTSIEDFLQNSLACNNAKKGLIEYSIKYSTGDFVYEYKLSLGFTSSSLQSVTDVEIDNGEIIV